MKNSRAAAGSREWAGRSLASHHHNITFRCLLAISSGYNTGLFIRYIIVLHCIFIALEGEHSSPLREDLAEHAHLQEQKWWLAVLRKSLYFSLRDCRRGQKTDVTWHNAFI
jgi:hypothetical protein